MRVIFSRFFWGLLLILFGVGLILERIFDLDLPLWRIFWSIVLIALGIGIILPHDRKWKDELKRNAEEGDIVFEEARIEGDESKNKYDVVFGKAVIDLTKLAKPSKNRKIEINTVFGSAIAKTNQNLPIKIKVTSAFGEATLPNGRSTAFGDSYYETKAYDPKKPAIFIEANVVFGKLEIN